MEFIPKDFTMDIELISTERDYERALKKIDLGSNPSISLRLTKH